MKYISEIPTGNSAINNVGVSTVVDETHQRALITPFPPKVFYGEKP